MAYAQSGRHLITENDNVKRWNSGVQGRSASDQGVGGPMRPQRPAPSVADPFERAPQNGNDRLIRRDGQPVALMQNYVKGGLTVNDWTGAGPARTTIWTERGQTLTPRSGGKVRWLQNPAAPGYGLHTEVNNDASGARGSAARYTDPAVPQQSRRRQNRLSPSRNTGQSFSQTTKIQGAR